MIPASFPVKLICALLLISVALTGNTADLPTYSAVHYPPFINIDSEGNISGSDIEITKAAFKAVGQEIKIQSEPWSRAVKNAEHGRIAGLISCTHTNDRAKFVHFSEPVNHINIGLIVKADYRGQLPPKFAGMSSLKMLAIRGWSTQKILTKHGIEHTSAESMAEAFNLLIFRDYDAIHTGLESGRFYAKTTNQLDLIRSHTFEDKVPTALYLCTSKKHPNALKLHQSFAKGLNIIRENGILDNIRHKYGM